jgi:hypothetical protein
MIYQRASKGSLDKWAELTGDPDWTFEKRFADYQKSVSFTAPKVSYYFGTKKIQTRVQY